MVRILKYITLILCVLSLSGCWLVFSLVMKDAFNCKLNINERYLRNDCGLTNGVRFEKLEVLSKNELGVPSEYYSTIRFECSYDVKDFNEVREEWPNKLYFQKGNKNYSWAIDTVFYHYRKTERYKSRERVYNDSIIPTYIYKNIRDTIGARMVGDLNEYFMNGKDGIAICPVEFEKQTWYYLEFFDQHFVDVFLYVDEKKKFQLYEFDSGVSPI